MNASSKDITKPLKVQFQNEEGEDEGGIRKEFFMLLFQEFLQPTYIFSIAYFFIISLFLDMACF